MRSVYPTRPHTADSILAWTGPPPKLGPTPSGDRMTRRSFGRSPGGGEITSERAVQAQSNSGNESLRNDSQRTKFKSTKRGHF